MNTATKKPAAKKPAAKKPAAKKSVAKKGGGGEENPVQTKCSRCIYGMLYSLLTLAERLPLTKPSISLQDLTGVNILLVDALSQNAKDFTTFISQLCKDFPIQDSVTPFQASRSDVATITSLLLKIAQNLEEFGEDITMNPKWTQDRCEAWKAMHGQIEYLVANLKPQP